MSATLKLTLTVLTLTVLLALSGRLLARPAATGAAFPYEVSVVAAFAAGLLAILSPCSGAILPAFFGFALDAPRGARLELAYVFWLGLATVFVPIGFATSLLASAFSEHRDLFFLAGGLVLLGLGAATLLDLGAWVGRWTRGITRSGQSWLARERSLPAKAYGLGLVFGFATSSCTAPILGAIQTLALGSAADSLGAIALFLVFALGIVAPMFALAWAFDHARLRRLGQLRRTVRLGRVELPLARLITGVVLLALGVAFIAFRGTLDLTERYTQWGATDLYGDLNDALVQATNGAAGWIFLGIGAIVAAAAWWAWRRRARGADALKEEP